MRRLLMSFGFLLVAAAANATPLPVVSSLTRPDDAPCGCHYEEYEPPHIEPETPIVQTYEEWLEDLFHEPIPEWILVCFVLPSSPALPPSSLPPTTPPSSPPTVSTAEPSVIVQSLAGAFFVLTAVWATQRKKG